MRNLFVMILGLLLTVSAGGQAARPFVLYDALAYAGKPDLAGEGLHPLYLMYQAALTKPDPTDGTKQILDFDKVHQMAELSLNFPRVMVSTDIEAWFGDSSVSPEEMALRYEQLFAVFREKNPGVVIGNYGLAPSALCVYRFYDGGKTGDEELVGQWRVNNQKRWPSLHHADVCTPSVYIAQPDLDSWIRDLQITVAEIRQHEPEKKIIVYLWPQYYNKPGSPYGKQFLTGEKWRGLLEAVYEHCDGAILWSSTTDETESLVRWGDPRVQAVWEATRDFMAAHGDGLIRPELHDDPIVVDDPDKSFRIYASIDYPGTPDLASHGLHPLRVIDEKAISTGQDANGIYQPDSVMISQLAQSLTASPDMPLFMLNGSWIRDRSSDPAAMVSRFEKAYRIFRRSNDRNPLWFFQVGPSSLSGLRTTNGNFFVNTGNWMISAVIPTRPLRGIPDAVVPSVYLTDDDTALWKREFLLTINEARLHHPGKPVYALLYTDYFNQKANFAGAYLPVSEPVWATALETVYKQCDGVILRSIGGARWEDAVGLWRATQQFIDDHREQIVFPDSIGDPGEEEGNNIIENGDFEDPIDPSAIETTFGVDYVAPLRSIGFFDDYSQTTNPASGAVAIPDYVWFERGTAQHQCRVNVESSRSFSGVKSITLFNVGGSTSDATAKLFAYHNLAQRVSLDDTKTYTFRFYVQRDFVHRGKPNLIDELYVGIISSTGAVSASNSTYYQILDIPDNQEWNEMSVTFDLPRILLDHPGKSFKRSALFIAMKTGWDEQDTKTLQSKVNIDDVWLTEDPNTSVTKHIIVRKPGFHLNDRTITVTRDYQRFLIYDLYGRILHVGKRNPSGGNRSFRFTHSGSYIIGIDQEKCRIFVH